MYPLIGTGLPPSVQPESLIILIGEICSTKSSTSDRESKDGLETSELCLAHMAAARSLHIQLTRCNKRSWRQRDGEIPIPIQALLRNPGFQPFWRHLTGERDEKSKRNMFRHIYLTYLGHIV